MRFPKPTKSDRVKAKRATRADRAAKLQEIATTAGTRAGGRCEFCRVAKPAQLHHLVSGSGKRRRHESHTTVAFVCVECHERYHASDEHVLVRAAEWAEWHRYDVALGEIRRRLARRLHIQAT